MYYGASVNLIANNPSDSHDLVSMDRAIARSYSPTGYGWLDEGILQLRTNLHGAHLNNLTRRYEREKILVKYIALKCSNGHLFDPAEAKCPECDITAANATSSGVVRYRVEVQPQQAIFDPATARGPFDAFLSYRHNDKERLAADLYYSLLAHNQRVFLDGGNIPLGVDFDKVFLRAASQASHFICLASPSYFESPYCKKELAHSLRVGRNVIPISVDGGWSPPNDMPWLSRVHISNIQGTIQGLTTNLESHLLTQIRQQPAPMNYDFQLEACSYLLAQLGEGDLTRIIGRLTWLSRIAYRGVSMDDLTISIQREVGNDRTRLQELCTSLSP